MEILVLSDKNHITFDECDQLTRLVGWGDPYYPSESAWQRIITASSHIAYVRQDNLFVGFGRVIEDGMMCMFYDVCVHPHYQKQGIGSAVMKNLLSKLEHHKFVSVGLFVWEGNKTAHQFYGKLGFKQVVAMEKR